MNAFYTIFNKLFNRIVLRCLAVILLLLSGSFSGFGQCPANLDFETGTFDGWICYAGDVTSVNGQNLIQLESLGSPLPAQHTMLSSSPGDGLDEYGGFPKNCPNGSGHSIKLGNNQAGGFAEGISYDFTIPANANKFTLTYNYAVVFEDPGHDIDRQPRLVVEVRNVTDDESIDCFSFSYVAYSSLPGFLTSSIRTSESPVRYKDWTTNTIYLNGYQGKTIRFFVKTADCTYAIHFGYAYIDVTSRCESNFSGATFCAQDTAVDVSAPNGYQSYKWYNNNYTQLLGTQQTLHFMPPPPAGTNVFVELTPFPGYGCQDTLQVELQDTLVAFADAGPDVSSCNFNPVTVGKPPIAGMRYRWSPSYGLSDPALANPKALPVSDTTYVLTMQSTGGGCLSSDTVRVFVKNIDNSILLTGDRNHCLDVGPDPVLTVHPADQIQWYKDDQIIPGANQTSYSVRSTGSYYAALLNNICVDAVNTNKVDMDIDTAAAGITYPVKDIALNFPVELAARNFGSNFLWTPATSLSAPGIRNPYFKGINEQLYTIAITTPLGCVTVDTQLIKTHKEIAIYVPNIFTPDGNGNNDYLRPLLLGIEKLKYFRIYNRAGQVIFETKTDVPGWDGKINGLEQETQTIVWMLEAVDIDGKTHFRKGSTLLLH